MPIKLTRWFLVVLLGLLILVLPIFLWTEENPLYEKKVALTTEERMQMEHTLDAQLGLLSGRVSQAERTQAAELLERIWPLRTARIEKSKQKKTKREKQLLHKLNQLYEAYTTKYLGDGGNWKLDDQAERVLQVYEIESSGEIRAAQGGEHVTEAEQEEYRELWNQMTALLPEHALEHFTVYTVFTDGPDQVLAYVNMVDEKGEKWEIAVDPADAKNPKLFYETIIHEYSHYLTLNSTQVTYARPYSSETYSEDGMVSKKGSYLDSFYQTFWTDILDDRLANMETYNFYLRHLDTFVTAYASTDPSEDIAESFTYFVLQEQREGERIWMQKQTYFYQYPEFVDFRTKVQNNLARLGT